MFDAVAMKSAPKDLAPPIIFLNFAPKLHLSLSD